MPAAVRHFDNDGATQLTAQNWPDAVAGVTQTARKFCIENSGDRTLEGYIASIVQIGSNDGNSMLEIGLDTATLSKPYGVTATLTAAGVGGVWGATGTYYYRITAYNGTGETVGSTEVSATVDVTTKKVSLAWDQISGASGYKVYRSTTSGSYTDTLRTTLVGASSNSFTDDGSAVGAGSLPSTNTTAGASPTYGTAPSLGAGPITFGDLEIDQQAFYWVNRVIPAGTPEIGNPRQAYVQFEES